MTFYFTTACLGFSAGFVVAALLANGRIEQMRIERDVFRELFHQRLRSDYAQGTARKPSKKDKPLPVESVN